MFTSPGTVAQVWFFDLKSHSQANASFSILASMKILIYNDLAPDQIPGFAKVRKALESGNFAQADVRKIGENLYRARLNRCDRLFFPFTSTAASPTV